MATTTTNTSNNAAAFNIDRLIAINSETDETTVNKTSIPQVRHGDKIKNTTSHDGNIIGKLLHYPVATSATPIMANSQLKDNCVHHDFNPVTSATVNEIPFLNNTLNYPLSMTGKS